MFEVVEYALLERGALLPKRLLVGRFENKPPVLVGVLVETLNRLDPEDGILENRLVPGGGALELFPNKLVVGELFEKKPLEFVGALVLVVNRLDELELVVPNRDELGLEPPPKVWTGAGVDKPKMFVSVSGGGELNRPGRRSST